MIKLFVLLGLQLTGSDNIHSVNLITYTRMLLVLFTILVTGAFANVPNNETVNCVDANESYLRCFTSSRYLGDYHLDLLRNQRRVSLYDQGVCKYLDSVVYCHNGQYWVPRTCSPLMAYSPYLGTCVPLGLANYTGYIYSTTGKRILPEYMTNTIDGRVCLTPDFVNCDSRVVYNGPVTGEVITFKPYIYNLISGVIDTPPLVSEVQEYLSPINMSDSSYYAKLQQVVDYYNSSGLYIPLYEPQNVTTISGVLYYLRTASNNGTVPTHIEPLVNDLINGTYDHRILKINDRTISEPMSIGWSDTVVDLERTQAVPAEFLTDRSTQQCESVVSYRIVNGLNSYRSSVISIVYNGLARCSGVVYATTATNAYILTAGHCDVNLNMKVCLVNRRCVPILGFKVPTTYRRTNTGVLKDDITLVVTEYVSDYMATCAPIANIPPLPGQSCIAVGYGVTSFGTLDPGTQREVVLTVVSDPGDFGDTTGLFRLYSPDKDTCSGDSGGPVFCFVNGSYYLSGLVSSGVGCATLTPGFYTDLSVPAISDMAKNFSEGTRVLPVVSTSVSFVAGRQYLPYVAVGVHSIQVLKKGVFNVALMPVCYKLSTYPTSPANVSYIDVSIDPNPVYITPMDLVRSRQRYIIVGSTYVGGNSTFTAYKSFYLKGITTVLPYATIMAWVEFNDSLCDGSTTTNFVLNGMLRISYLSFQNIWKSRDGKYSNDTVFSLLGLGTWSATTNFGLRQCATVSFDNGVILCMAPDTSALSYLYYRIDIDGVDTATPTITYTVPTVMDRNVNPLVGTDNSYLSTVNSSAIYSYNNVQIDMSSTRVSYGTSPLTTEYIALNSAIQPVYAGLDSPFYRTVIVDIPDAATCADTFSKLQTVVYGNGTQRTARITGVSSSNKYCTRLLKDMTERCSDGQCSVQYDVTNVTTPADINVTVSYVTNGTVVTLEDDGFCTVCPNATFTQGQVTYMLISNASASRLVVISEKPLSYQNKDTFAYLLTYYPTYYWTFVGLVIAFCVLLIVTIINRCCLTWCRIKETKYGKETRMAYDNMEPHNVTLKEGKVHVITDQASGARIPIPLMLRALPMATKYASNFGFASRRASGSSISNNGVLLNNLHTKVKAIAKEAVEAYRNDNTWSGEDRKRVLSLGEQPFGGVLPK